MFVHFAFQIIEAGADHYSAACICEQIRWHTDLKTKGHGYKINDHHTAYYARLFHLAYPQHEGFFRNRKTSAACGEHEQRIGWRLFALWNDTRKRGIA